MADPIAAWREEHEYFARLLQMLQKQVDVFQSGGRPKYTLMQDIISYLRAYSDRFHHPREDVAFERLARHCPDIALVLARLQQEHRVIAHAGAALLAQIDAVLGGAILSREELEAAAATYLVYYQNHIRTEENTVLARAAKHLSAADWDAVRAAVAVEPDPLFGPTPQERYSELRRQIAQEGTAGE